MLTRPIYETAANRAAEQEVAGTLATKLDGLMDYEFVKLHHTYRLDFAVYAGRDKAGAPAGLRAFVEVKDRSARFRWSHFEGHGAYRIALHKWQSAADLCRVAEVPFFLAIKCRDGLYVAELRPDRMILPSIVHGGRTDRKVRCPSTGALIPDPGDQEPMVEIPVHHFNKVS